MLSLMILSALFASVVEESCAARIPPPLKMLASLSLSGQTLLVENSIKGIPHDVSAQDKPLQLRANKASRFTQAQVRERIVPQLEKGMTEANLQKALDTLPVLTGNGELLWVLKDGIILTSSLEGKEESKIVCWLIRSDR